MNLTTQITCRNIVLTSAEEERLEEQAARLDRFFEKIHHCAITVEGPGGHHRHGRVAIRIRLTVPGRELSVSHQAGETFDDAVREAFAAAGRVLEDFVRRLRGDVKVAAPTLDEGVVVRIFPDKGYGFLEADGREVYFHRNAVQAPGFGRIGVGAKVRFAVEIGEKGPQATTVMVA